MRYYEGVLKLAYPQSLRFDLNIFTLSYLIHHNALYSVLGIV